MSLSSVKPDRLLDRDLPDHPLIEVETAALP
jgi:hypothetical protein